jgi:hypothetical protein
MRGLLVQATGGWLHLAAGLQVGLSPSFSTGQAVAYRTWFVLFSVQPILASQRHVQL